MPVNEKGTQRLLIATNNSGKIKEIRSLLDLVGLELITPAQIGLKLDVAETGSTYAENAALKAKAFAGASGIWTLADDSGLEVDVLGGEPGIHSARIVQGIGASDAIRRQRLLEKLKDHRRPWQARFHCVVAFTTRDADLEFAEGICEGEIIPDERGENGFGYDPIFLLSNLNKSMAELSMAEKNQLSHRARAIRAILPVIQKHIENI